PRADAAGIVTHAWMGLDAIDRVQDPQLHALLDAHRDQVRAGAEFPDGGYWTRAQGTPGGDYGEEAHWQRFVDAYTAQIRNDPACGDLTDPNGPCAPTIAHLMGAAAHGMGDEVWDWLFEPNGPGFDESYLPPDFTPFVGPGGLELQLDIVAIARHGRPTGPTPAIPDPAKIDAAFAAVGRGDIDPSSFDVGEGFLDVERAAEAFWAPRHIDALERAMPWTSYNMTRTGGGVDFAARAISGYFETIWANLLGQPHTTHVAATAPYDGQRNVPYAGWTGNYSPGSNAGNSGGLTRIAAALSSALPYHALAGQGSQPSELPAGSLRLRDLTSGQLVPARAGYPRIVPYNPEAGEHVIAFQPAADLQPCRWYRVETTTALVDAQAQSVAPAQWQFRTSGCTPPQLKLPVHGTVHCDASGSARFTRIGDQANVRLALTNCSGGQDGTPQHRKATMNIASGRVHVQLSLPTSSCSELTEPTAPSSLTGTVRWYDAAGRTIGMSRVAPQAFDTRGAVVRLAGAFVLDRMAVRWTPDVTGCTGSTATETVPLTAGHVTVFPQFA
ncbi:MAG TPA: hypothetical protein VFX21_03205, partial [Acidimicrobiia bacterium]|nr:hypothetical protein [Acidimicrobiia bacterium]